MKLRGIIPPVVTLIDEGERVDESAFAAHLCALIESGVHGLFVLGSAGECVSLRDTEKRRAIKVAVEHAKGKLPILVGTMDTSTMRTIDNARVAEDMGADAVVVTPPFYYNHTRDEVIRHYEMVAKSTGLPLVIYNIPQLTKFHLSARDVSVLIGTGNIIGIKDSSGSWSNLLELLETFGGRDDFSILIGDEDLTCAGLLMGADGAIMAIANLAPRLAVRIYEAASNGHLDELRALQRELLKLLRIYKYGSPLACLKAALSIAGVGNGKACEPIGGVSESAYECIRQILLELRNCLQTRM
ncbi:MAG: hypothetical protein GDYSWBUE_000531 [Candidatus Fervidibacterota bacterium]